MTIISHSFKHCFIDLYYIFNFFNIFIIYILHMLTKVYFLQNWEKEFSFVLIEWIWMFTLNFEPYLAI